MMKVTSRFLLCFSLGHIGRFGSVCSSQKGQRFSFTFMIQGIPGWIYLESFSLIQGEYALFLEERPDFICMRCYDDFRLKTTTVPPLFQNVQLKESKRKKSEELLATQESRYRAVRFVVRRERKK